MDRGLDTESTENSLGSNNNDHLLRNNKFRSLSKKNEHPKLQRIPPITMLREY